MGINNFVNRDPNIRATKGVFFIQYMSRRDRRRVKGRPYVILHDLFDFTICVSSYRHLKYLAERMPEIRWLLEWTTFDPYLFSVARCHSGLCVPFTIDWRRYACHVFEGAKERGIELNGKAFMAYRCSQAAFDSGYSGLELADPPKAEDYSREIIKSNARFSVDDESEAMADWDGKEPEPYGDDH